MGPKEKISKKFKPEKISAPKKTSAPEETTAPEFLDFKTYIQLFDKALENLRIINGINETEIFSYSEVFGKSFGGKIDGLTINAKNLLSLSKQKEKVLGKSLLDKIIKSIDDICRKIEKIREDIIKYNESVQNKKKLELEILDQPLNAENGIKRNEIKISDATIKLIKKRIKDFEAEDFFKTYSDEVKKKIQDKREAREAERKAQEPEKPPEPEPPEPVPPEPPEPEPEPPEPEPELITDFVVDMLERIRPQPSTSFDADGLLQIVASVGENTSLSVNNIGDILQTIAHIEEKPKSTFDFADVLQILPGIAEKTSEETDFGQGHVVTQLLSLKGAKHPENFGDLLQIIGSVSEAVAEFDSDFIVDMLDKIGPQISQHFEISDLLSVVADVEEEEDINEAFMLGDIFSMLADVEEQRPDLETDFIIDILDKIKPQISQHFDIDGLLQIIPNIEEKISESTDNFPDILATIADIREQHSKPFMIDGLLELLPNITGPSEKQIEPFEFSDLLQIISTVNEVVAEFDSDFIIDILEKIKPQVSQHFDFNGLLETIAAVEEKEVEEFIFSDLLDMLSSVEEDMPTLESDFIIDILEKIQPQLAKPVDFNGLLSVISEIEEDKCERDLKACKAENKRLLEQINNIQNGVLPPQHNESDEIEMNNGVLEVVANIDTSNKVIDESDVGGILEVIGNIGVSDKVLDEADFGGILELLSSVNEEEVGKGKDGKSLKACKVIEYVNADGEKETLYPFALIQGRCYYYNKNRDILNDNLEIV